MSIVAGFLGVKANRVVLGEAKNLNAIVLERYGGGGGGNNQVQEINAATLVSISIVDDPTGGVSGIITTQPSGAVVDNDGFIYSGTRNNDAQFKKFDPVTNAQVVSLFTGPAFIIFANWIPDNTNTRQLVTCCSDNPMTVHLGLTGTLVATAAHQAASGMIGACYDSANHLWVFYVNVNGTTADTYLIDVGHAEYTLPGNAGYGAYRAMWNSPGDNTLVFLTYLGYFVKWDVVSHAIIGSPVLHSELATIGNQIGCDMAKYMTNQVTNRIWVTAADGFTLNAYDATTLALVETHNLRTLFAGIPNFPSSTWMNSSPCGFLPYTRAFIGWAEPGGSNNYTWYIWATTPSPTSNILVSLNGTTHSFGDAFTLQDTVTGTTPTGTTTFYEGATVLGSATVVNSVAVLTLSPTLSVGTHVVHAVYNGDFQNATSVSNDLTLVVTSAQSIVFGYGSHSTTKDIKAHNQKYWFNEEQQRKLRHK